MKNWIEFGKSWREFKRANLAVVGTVVEIDGREFLIGDINELGGVCDDCMDFEYEAIVTQYRVAKIE